MLFQLTLNLQPSFSNLHTLSESQRDVSEIVSPLNEQENLFSKKREGEQNIFVKY